MFTDNKNILGNFDFRLAVSQKYVTDIVNTCDKCTLISVYDDHTWFENNNYVYIGNSTSGKKYKVMNTFAYAKPYEVTDAEELSEIMTEVLTEYLAKNGDSSYDFTFNISVVWFKSGSVDVDSLFTFDTSIWKHIYGDNWMNDVIRYTVKQSMFTTFRHKTK